MLPWIVGRQFAQGGNFVVEGDFDSCFLFQKAAIARVDVAPLAAADGRHASRNSPNLLKDFLRVADPGGAFLKLDSDCLLYTSIGDPL